MAKQASLYSIHPGVKMVQKWAENLKKNTGRALEEWTELLQSLQISEKEKKEWLKQNHGFGTNMAAWLVERSAGRGFDEDEDSYLITAEKYVLEMFSGNKIHLKPLYDSLLELGFSLGKDVRVCPCKTIVPLYRNHVFAEIKPATQKRIDLGLALKNLEPTGRLISTGGFQKKDRITHRISITCLNEIDEEVNYWMQTAYKLDA